MTITIILVLIFIISILGVSYIYLINYKSEDLEYINEVCIKYPNITPNVYGYL